jgi:hypothetical protein
VLNELGFYSADFNNSDLKLDITATPLHLGLEYGLTQNLAVGAILNYANLKYKASGCSGGQTCNTSTMKGMTDPAIYLKGQSDAGSGSLMYGAAATLGMGTHKINSSGGSDDLYVSGTTFTPYIGYQMPAGPGVWGARFQYELYSGDRKSSNQEYTPTRQTVSKGGNEWTIDTFVETPMSGWTLGGDLFYSSEVTSRDSVNGGKTTDNNDESTTLGLEAYAAIPLSAVTILPHVSYSNEDFSNSNSTLSSAKVFGLGVAARFVF